MKEIRKSGNPETRTSDSNPTVSKSDPLEDSFGASLARDALYRACSLKALLDIKREHPEIDDALQLEKAERIGAKRADAIMTGIDSFSMEKLENATELEVKKAVKKIVDSKVLE